MPPRGFRRDASGRAQPLHLGVTEWTSGCYRRAQDRGHPVVDWGVAVAGSVSSGRRSSQENKRRSPATCRAGGGVGGPVEPSVDGRVGGRVGVRGRLGWAPASGSGAIRGRTGASGAWSASFGWRTDMFVPQGRTSAGSERRQGAGEWRGGARVKRGGLLHHVRGQCWRRSRRAAIHPGAFLRRLDGPTKLGGTSA